MQTIDSSAELLTVGELARRADVSESCVRRWVSNGQLACLRTERGQRLFPRGEAVRFLEGRQAKSSTLKKTA